MKLPLTMSVPDAGRMLYDLGRDASYLAAEKGVIPARRVGRRLVVPTHAALAGLGWSDDLIAQALGLGPDSTNDESPAQASPSASIHALTKSTGDPHDDTTPAA